MIPVAIVTGFLGSGKTSLLSRLLRRPDQARSAVIINEFGEIGLDHDLIEAGDETLVTLANGCLCCRVLSDLSRTLVDLAVRRQSGEIAFERVFVETSGLADPAPILHAVMSDPALAETYALAGLYTLVDAATGPDSLQRHVEARRQAALADTLLISKTDLAEPAEREALRARLAALNPDAPVLEAARWDGPGTERARAVMPPPSGHEHEHGHHGHDHGHDHGHAHTADIAAVTFERAEPLPASAILLFLEALAMHEGDRLLRFKGLVHVAEMPHAPMAVHGVQHVFHKPAWLSAWPPGPRTTRMVLIGHDLSPRWPRLMLEAIEAELADLAGERAADAAARHQA